MKSTALTEELLLLPQIKFHDAHQKQSLEHFSVSNYISGKRDKTILFRSVLDQIVLN